MPDDEKPQIGRFKEAAKDVCADMIRVETFKDLVL